MNDEKILDKINEEIVRLTPDNYDAIAEKCRNRADSTNVVPFRKKNNNVRRYLAVAAAFAVVVCAVFAFYSPSGKIESVIELDVNPSVEISADRNDKIVEVTPLNQDGVVIIDDMDFKGVDLDITVNALIGSMLKNGYITETQNAVLVSVSNKNETKQQQLLKKVSDDINDALSISKVQGAVLTQSLAHEEKTDALAQQYGISEGKALFIEYICSENPNRSYESLVGLSISELALLVESDQHKFHQTHPDEADNFKVSVSGEVNKATYIGEEAALKIALEDLKAAKEDISIPIIGFEQDNGILVYDIEFTVNEFEYEYEINALTGAIEDKEADFDGYYDANGEPMDYTTNADMAEYISKEEAKHTALTHAGLTAEVISEYDIELDNENGSIYYEIEFIKDEFSYEYKIDAVSGKIVQSEKELND